MASSQLTFILQPHVTGQEIIDALRVAAAEIEQQLGSALEEPIEDIASLAGQNHEGTTWLFHSSEAQEQTLISEVAHEEYLEKTSWCMSEEEENMLFPIELREPMFPAEAVRRHHWIREQKIRAVAYAAEYGIVIPALQADERNELLQLTGNVQIDSQGPYTGTTFEDWNLPWAHGWNAAMSRILQNSTIRRMLFPRQYSRSRG
jgi:hypothetical protein